MIFLLGDNRAGSQDSRMVGPISLNDLVGIVVAARQPAGEWTPIAD